MFFGRTILLPNYLSEIRTSPMTSPVRSTLMSILCCVIALGHAPAWMHVATCDGHCSYASVENGACGSGVSHSCGCHSHGSDATAKDDRPDPPPAHDSDSCHICQSLAAPSGVVDHHCPQLVSDSVCELAVSRLATVYARSSISWPPLRGPPTEHRFSTV